MTATEVLQNPDLTSLLGAVIVSVISGAVSITQRIARGQPPSFIWVCSEFLTAILCGYLMHASYPQLEPYLPEWATPVLAVAFMAHSGGRVIQEIERRFLGNR